ncbi:MAG: primosomal protein N' [Gammaproteobacteria bacterium]|nr:primosomal protein N' [Gammaproteobacteria bacterium]MBT8057875.1 primosomal protein N' [Gammaproteobacteria bacterium]NNJ79973.1 primosomal protein N' [Xanthomonadales bacterium]
MNAASCLRVALPVPLPQLFDYLPRESGRPAVPGGRVSVPFGKRRLVGIVIETGVASEIAPDRLQRVETVLDDGEALLDERLLALLHWCWQYYKRAPGDVVAAALPPALRTARGQRPPPPQIHQLTDAGRERLGAPPGRETARYALLEAMAPGPQTDASLRGLAGRWRATLDALIDKGMAETVMAPLTEAQPQPGPELRSEQRTAVDAIVSNLGRFRCHLLDGVTGSGKTEVYMCVLEQVLTAGQQALVLVPEIGLTPQLLRRFSRRLGVEPNVIHSGLAAGERLAAWEAARTGRAPLLVGTRSALFTPMPRLGLVVLDEEHDASFKQQEGFRYSARDVAVKRAAELNIPVVLGSATPSLESLRNAKEKRYDWQRLRERATRAALPSWRVLDLRQQRTLHGLTETALDAVSNALDRGEQVMVFLNRRGYAPVLMCQSCGWHGLCERCDANLTWHRGGGRLCCHHCGHQRRAPELCPECRADALVGAGEGTQQLEEYLAKQFESVPVLRFDRDRVSRKGVMDEQLAQVREGECCLMVGTQMLAKGHHFPGVTLVVIVNTDQALYSADYRALERMGQMIQQVAGRAGRAEKPGTVILQTLHPEHPALSLLLEKGYAAYAEWLLEERKLAGLPPCGHQALLRADAHDRADVERFLRDALACFPRGAARAFGPVPAIMERIGGRWRMYLVLLAEDRSGLHRQVDHWLPRVRGLSTARKVRWSMDIDPQEL